MMTNLNTTSTIASFGTTNKSTNCTVEDISLGISLGVLYSLIFLIGLVGNVLALWVFLCIHKKKNSIYFLLVNVAMADLLLVVCLPFRVIYHLRGNKWSLGPTLCRVIGNMFYMNMYISITLLGLISIDRYLKIHRCKSRRKFLRGSWSVVICGITWAVALGCTIVMISTPEQMPNKEKCFHYRQTEKLNMDTWIKIFLVILFWLVYAALVVSYRKITIWLSKASKKKPDLPNAHKYSQTARKSFFVLFLFTLCFVPYHIVRIFYIISQISKTTCHWQNVADKANEVALVISTFNSCLDPAMYFLLCSSVRRTTKEALQKVFWQLDKGTTTTYSSEGKSLKDRRLSVGMICNPNVKTETLDMKM
ncbi:putative G-protein coupled receptor 34b isoform X2 [Denticeps clupeoides]|uniref:Probable G-protein coupled receptor 34 n=2 Tax=Denticeps clupeoides TaxID=299321 RepID=A0AAY4DV40_9TELE|nr:probable G-protein coupled receptor 34 isoform X2 [Denticeps clupeoides]XP_028848081.1 probable G-protein coupled receptor 34 isoform X2 [Denticeps clupeoides]